MTRQKIGFYVCAIIMPLVVTWLVVGQILQSRLTIDKCIKVTGIIDKTREVTTNVKKKLLYTHKDVELRIYLKDTPEYFRIMDIYKYQQFLAEIINGDTAEIFIRPKWLVPLGLGYRNDVFQMAVNGQTIFDISQTRRYTNGQNILFAIITIPLLIFLGRWVRRQPNKT